MQNQEMTFKTHPLLFFCILFSFLVSGAFSQETTFASPSNPALPAPTTSPSINSASDASSTNLMPAHCDSMESPAPEGGIKNNKHRSYSSVRVDGPYIALTFDDGPSATLTPRLLDILKEKGVKATFFVVGENAQSHPEILARAVAEGHEIGNHSWSHPQLSKVSEARLQEEIGNTSNAIFKATGKTPSLLRPPYGAVNAHVRQVIQDQYGMKIIFWSVDPLDWKRPGSSAVSQRILANTKAGSIILSHDIHAGTVDAMPTTIDALLAKGYHFVTVSELIEMESKNPAPAASSTSSAKNKNRSKKNS